MRIAQAARAQPLHQRDHLFEHFEHRLEVDNLRADVAAHAFQFQVRVLRRLLIDRLRFSDIDAELMLAQTRRYVRMRSSVHIGIDPQRDRGPDTASGQRAN